MGNDNKIKELVSISSKEYLAKTFSGGENTSAYNLENEFAKTKKNRSFFVPLISLITVLALIAIAVVFSGIIAKNTASQKVDVSSFEDLNLKDLLDVVKRAEENYERLSREYSDIEQSMKSELNLADLAYKSELDIINAERLSESTRRDRLNTTAKKNNSKISGIESRYTQLLIDKKAELEEAAKIIDSLDSRSLEQAKRNEEILASERQLFNAEKTRISDYYEQRLRVLSAEAQEEKKQLISAKDALLQALEKSKAEELAEQFALYNPVFTEQTTLSIINDYMNQVDSPDNNLKEILTKSGAEATLSLQQINRAIEGIHSLSLSLMEIPYQNSVPKAINALNNAALSLAVSYQNIITNLAKLLEAKLLELEIARTELAQAKSKLDTTTFEADTYISALESMARANGDSGYILAIKNDTLYLWLDPLASGAKEAWVYRNEKAIARLSLAVNGRLFIGKIIDQIEGQVRIFDKLLVNMGSDTIRR